MGDTIAGGAAAGFSFGGAGDIRMVADWLREAIAADPECQRILSTGGDALRSVSDLKMDFDRDGAPRMRRFYWSLQNGGSGSGRPFEARTWSYYYKDGAGAFVSFPQDPNLARANALLGMFPDADILRYVPLRRLTFAADHGGGRIAGKIKQPHRYADAARRLELAGDAARRCGSPLRIPELTRIDHNCHAYFQTWCAGENCAHLINRQNAGEIGACAGEALAALHALPHNGLPEIDSASILADAGQAVAIVAALVPHAARQLGDCLGLLRGSVPAKRAPVFCHGDYSLGQLLAGGDATTIVDFDLSHRGDARRDLGFFLASLFSEDALTEGDCLSDCQNAFIAAYGERSGSGEACHTLHWHRACAELHFLMLTIRKDIYDSGAFSRRLDRLTQAARQASK